MTAINPKLVTTAFDLPGHHIVRNIGVVRGIVVRSRSIVGTLGASLQTLVGGNITLFTQMCERARDDAFDTTPTKLQRASLKCLPTARRLSSNRSRGDDSGFPRNRVSSSS